MDSLTPDTPCPCGKGTTFAQCCQPALSCNKAAPSAEALMRSRYTAFATGHIDYLLATHHPSQHQPNERSALQNSIADCQWLSLRILDTDKGQPGDTEGIVEFIAHYQQSGEQGLLHERSRFVFEDGRWFYVDGEFPQTAASQPGRNDPCWCNSGKKFKKCHGR